MKSSRRHFLELTGGSLAALTLSSCDAPAPVDPSPDSRLAASFAELNDAAAIGVTPEDFELARPYVTGVFREAQAKLRSMALRDDLEIAVRFTPRTEQ